MNSEAVDSEKIDELKERLARGEYAVDPVAVAEAILRRAPELGWLDALLPTG